MAELTKFKGEQITIADVNVVFKGEEGIDGGGLSREWITLALKEVFNPDVGLFTTTSNGVTMRPNPLSYTIPCYL